jgi:hypothetical protein
VDKSSRYTALQNSLELNVDQPASQASFIKTVVLTILFVGAGVGLFVLGSQAGDTQSHRQVGMEKYVRAHRCVVAYEDRSYARLYQCGTGDNIKYITPSELRKAAVFEAVQGPEG